MPPKNQPSTLPSCLAELDKLQNKRHESFANRHVGATKNTWVSHVKTVAAANNLTYGQAMVQASKTYKRKCELPKGCDKATYCAKKSYVDELISGFRDLLTAAKAGTLGRASSGGRSSVKRVLDAEQEMVSAGRDLNKLLKIRNIILNLPANTSDVTYDEVDKSKNTYMMRVPLKAYVDKVGTAPS